MDYYEIYYIRDRDSIPVYLYRTQIYQIGLVECEKKVNRKCEVLEPRDDRHRIEYHINMVNLAIIWSPSYVSANCAVHCVVTIITELYVLANSSFLVVHHAYGHPSVGNSNKAEPFICQLVSNRVNKLIV